METLDSWLKIFNVSICNISSQTPNCDYIDNGNITLNEVGKDGVHLSGKGIQCYVCII